MESNIIVVIRYGLSYWREKDKCGNILMHWPNHLDSHNNDGLLEEFVILSICINMVPNTLY